MLISIKCSKKLREVLGTAMVLTSAFACLVKKKKAPKSEEYLGCAAELQEELRLLKLSLNIESETPTGSEETTQELENEQLLVRSSSIPQNVQTETAAGSALYTAVCTRTVHSRLARFVGFLKKRAVVNALVLAELEFRRAMKGPKIRIKVKTEVLMKRKGRSRWRWRSPTAW